MVVMRTTSREPLPGGPLYRPDGSPRSAPTVYGSAVAGVLALFLVGGALLALAGDPRPPRDAVYPLPDDVEVVEEVERCDTVEASGCSLTVVVRHAELTPRTLSDRLAGFYEGRGRALFLVGDCWRSGASGDVALSVCPGTGNVRVAARR